MTKNCSIHERLGRQAADWCVVILLALIVATVFYKTLFLGQPISRISQLSRQDPVFGPPPPGLVYDTYDRAAYFQTVPNYLLTGRILQNACLPLWNPYSECGTPLLADNQSFALAPLRLLLSPWASLHLYNLIFVLYAFIGCVGTFMLGRSLGLQRYSSFFAALAYGFCPFILFSLELLHCSWFLPVLFWAFVRLTKNPCMDRAIVCGLCCAFAIYSSHCESVFFGITFATLWATLAIATDSKLSIKWHSRILKAITLISVAGFVAFCLSAPMLLPFVEYLTNSDCYKSTYATSRSSIPWQTIILCFTHPALEGASPFLGTLAAVLVPVSVAGVRTRELLVTIITNIIAFATVCNLCPMDWLLSTRVLCWFGTPYCLPILILLTAILSAFGLEALKTIKVGLNWRFLLITATIIVVNLVPVVFSYLKVPITLEGCGIDFHVNLHYWLKSLLILSILPVVLITKIRFAKWMPLLIVLLIAINFASMANATSKALPIQPDFHFNNEPPLPFLQKQGQRILSVGRSVLCPNTNVIYQIPSLLCFNVYHPRRILPFLNRSAISISGLTEIADVRLSKLVDLASIKYAISCYPILSQDDFVPPLPPESSGQEAIHFGSQITLKRASVKYDPINYDATGQLEWQISHADCARFIYSIVVTNHTGGPLWISGPCSFELPTNIDKGLCKKELAVSLPIHLTQGTSVIVGIQVLDLSTHTLVPVSSPQSGVSSTFAKLAEFTIKPPPTNKACIRHFRLIWETSKTNQLRLYENTRALPQAFLIHNVRMADSERKALDLISSDSFNPHREAVIEGQLSSPYPLIVKQENVNNDNVYISRTDPNHVRLQVRTNAPAILILTDTFYPGWIAYLNGKEVPILHANYLFRAIQIPPGTHLVEFAYRPAWFWIGILLACLCMASIIIKMCPIQYRS